MSTHPAKASTIKKLFSRETSITTNIYAKSDKIWALLVNAKDYPRWNKTIVSIEGSIAKGETIKLVSTLDPKRTFKLKVKEFEPATRLAWGDTMGTRIYTLEKIDAGTTRFTMVEKIGGPLFPLFAGMIPSFDESFETFADSLKMESEKSKTI